MFNELFATASTTTTTGTGNTLAGTQQLTNTAASIADQILSVVKASEDDEVAKLLVSSMSDMTALDKIISDNYNLDDVPINFLRILDDGTLDGMLKSQQSKRSRCKSKEMTVDNYRSMMTAAIAEQLIRLAMGKEKSNFSGRASGPVVYTESRLITLAADQEALRKEIRNIQSKKSILKSKAGFEESDERWQALLVAEEQLKGIRSDAPTTTKPVITVDTLRDDLKELLAEVDASTLSKKQLVELIDSIKLFVWPVETEQPEAEQTEDQLPADEDMHYSDGMQHNN